MEKLWKKLGFKPKLTSENIEEDSEEDIILDDMEVKQNGGFTPHFKKYGPPSSNDPFVRLTIIHLPQDDRGRGLDYSQ